MGLKMPGSMKTMSWAPPSGTGWEVGKIQLPFTCWMKLNPRVFRTVLGLCHYLWGVSYTSLNLYHFVNITVCYREWESPVPSPGSWEAVLITCRDWEEEVLRYCVWSKQQVPEEMFREVAGNLIEGFIWVGLTLLEFELKKWLLCFVITDWWECELGPFFGDPHKYQQYIVSLHKLKIKITLVCGIHAKAQEWRTQGVRRTRKTEAEGLGHIGTWVTPMKV